MIRNLIYAVLLLGSAFLIAIQVDELGVALTAGHKALFGVMIVLVFLALHSLWSFVEEYTLS